MQYSNARPCLLRVLCLSLIVSTKQRRSTWIGTSLVVLWENFTSRGVFSGVTSNRMPGKLSRTISLLLQLLRTLRDLFITFVGKSSTVKVIYAELLIVSRVKVRCKTLWQEKLGRTIPWSKIYLNSCKGFFYETGTRCLFRGFTTCL